jgi:uncharacterized protein YndB with AHSA1/START domain
MEKGSNQTVTDSKEVFITRTFNAPRELVFEAWTDPAHLQKWFAPDGCTIHFKSIDVLEGRMFHSCIHTPDGYDCWCKGKYLEIIRPERIVFTMAVADEIGNLISPVVAGMDPDWPEETTVTITLVEQDGKTTLTLQQTVSETLAKKTGAYPSWLQMFDILEQQLKN